jgi:hypothetical protein
VSWATATKAAKAPSQQTAGRRASQANGRGRSSTVGEVTTKTAMAMPMAKNSTYIGNHSSDRPAHDGSTTTTVTRMASPIP